MRPGQVVDEHPAHRHQPLSCLVPVARAAHHLHVAPAAAVPGHVQLGTAEPATTSSGVGNLAPLTRGRPWPAVGRRRFVQVGVGVELADQGQPAASPRREAGHLVRAVVAVAGSGRTAAAGTSAAARSKVAGANGPASCAGGRPWRCPSSLRYSATSRGKAHCRAAEGEADQHGQHHPLVTPAEGGEASAWSGPGRGGSPCRRPCRRGAHRRCRRRPGGRGPAGTRWSKTQPARAARQPPAGPAALGEDAVVAGGMARGQGTQGAQEVADGALADGQDGGQGQDDEAEEGRSREGTGQGVEEGTGRLGQCWWMCWSWRRAARALRVWRRRRLRSRRRSCGGVGRPRASGGEDVRRRGEVAILDMGASLMSMRAATFIAPRRLLLCDPLKKGKSRTKSLFQKGVRPLVLGDDL